MTENASRMHAQGMRYMLWFRVPFVGYHSEN